MSRPAPRNIGVGVFAETRLIADSLLHALQKESALACSTIDGFATVWTYRPDVVVIDWQEATEAKLKPPTEAPGSLLIDPVIPTEKLDHFHVNTIALNSIKRLRKFSVRR